MPAKLTTQTFIERASAKHDAKYDYSRVQYHLAHDHIEIGCPIHGWFRQKAYQHLNYGCKKCGDAEGTAKRATTSEAFVTRARAAHGDKYGYDDLSLRSLHDKVAIRCPVHGVFRQIANDHIRGRGCERCGVEASAATRRGVLGYGTDEFVAKAIAVHGDRYTYDRTIYTGARQMLTVTCPVHGGFRQSAANHLLGYGCSKCRKPLIPKTDPKRRTPVVTLGAFEIIAREVHGDIYDYQYFTTLSEKVGIVCREHGLFYQTGNDHIYSKAGCPICGRTAAAEKRRYTKEEFEERLRDKHDDRITLAAEYIDTVTSTTFACHAHGEFAATPEQILTQRHGCPGCWSAFGKLALRLTQEEFEAKANLVHRHKYQYGIYDGKAAKIEIDCPIHGTFHQSAGNHLAGMGCPACGVRKVYAQNKWLDMLGIKEREVWFTLDDKRIKADGYDASTRTIYKFWGDFWHGNPKLYDQLAINGANGKTFGDLYERTLNKRRLITDHGYRLVEIWESDWKRINGST